MKTGLPRTLSPVCDCPPPLEWPNGTYPFPDVPLPGNRQRHREPSPVALHRGRRSIDLR